MNFLRFQKPSRYIDNEFNARKKDWPVDVRVALSFPDIYEVGMSHLGLRILYDIINALPFAAAERAFAPWTDLKEYMKKSGVPLSSLETKRPLADFDIVGFSMQYELSCTTILDMLDLAGIALKSGERVKSRKAYPLVVAGGPSSVNPAPMAAFIDAFLIGDGEEAVVELVEAVRQWKKGGDGCRESILRAIAEIKGFYVPLIHGGSGLVKKRFVADLDSVSFPERQIVPYAPIVHDRVNIEVARGCTMGCRFCQAGMIYRPLRERSPEKVMDIAGKALKNTGYDEVSFTSLSSGDYRCLLPLIKEFNAKFGAARTAVSLPSLRVGSVSKEVLKEIRSVRKTGFTMAPEAATERLRRVINKDFTDEDYERALTALFEEGWLTLKLYFMIGLPTELGEDIEAINEMAMRTLRIAKKNTGKFVNINITVSPFVPKPHTPFQWCGQIPLDEMKHKLGFLKQSINAKKFRYKGHNEEMSFLEAVLARGDEKLCLLVEEAWRLGCRLDGWSEVFDFNKWLLAMEKTGIDGAAYAERRFEKDERLPWDNIGVGVSRDFLYREYEKAVKGLMTADCRKACAACGLGCGTKEIRSREAEVGSQTATRGEADAEARLAMRAGDGSHKPGPRVRVRVEFSKKGIIRCLSHLELVTAILRALRRAGVPHDFSKGFHPKPEVSFGPPLNAGVGGAREYFDMEVFAPFDVQLYQALLNSTLPEGIKINRMQVVPATGPSLTGFVSRYEFIFAYPPTPEKAEIVCMPAPAVYVPAEGLSVRREEKEVDLAPCIESMEQVEAADEQVKVLIGHDLIWAYRLVLRDREKVKVRIGEISEALFGMKMEDLAIVRTRQYGWKDGWREPL